MYDLEEIRLASALGRAIEQELVKGSVMPVEVTSAYLEIFEHWNKQIEKELS